MVWVCQRSTEYRKELNTLFRLPNAVPLEKQNKSGDMKPNTILDENLEDRKQEWD